MDEKQEATQFVWIFLAILGILVVVVAIMPQEGIPGRSKYLTEEEEKQALYTGKVILMFFFQPESKLSRQQAELVLDLDRTYDWLVVEWFNTKQGLGDRRVMDEIEHRNITAVPYFVAKSTTTEITHLGYLPRVDLEDLVIGIRP